MKSIESKFAEPTVLKYLSIAGIFMQILRNLTERLFSIGHW